MHQTPSANCAGTMFDVCIVSRGEGGATKIFPVVLQLRQECFKSPLASAIFESVFEFVHRRNHVTDTIKIRDDSIVSLFKAYGLS